MTTERLELRLYVVALLAIIYTISWRAIQGHPPARQPAPTTSEPQRFVWVDSLPPSDRPPIAQPAPIVRVPSRHVPRVRTRSS